MLIRIAELIAMASTLDCNVELKSSIAMPRAAIFKPTPALFCEDLHCFAKAACAAIADPANAHLVRAINKAVQESDYVQTEEGFFIY